MDEARVARIASRIAAERTADFESEAKALKLKKVIQDFYHDVGRFKGALNKVLDEILGAVDDKMSLREFPEFKHILQLEPLLKKGVLPQTFMSEKELLEKLERVMCTDTGSC